MKFFLGLDLGQAQDPTAIAVLERITAQSELPVLRQYATLGPGGRVQGIPSSWFPRGLPGPTVPPTFHCRHLERLRLGTSYPDVADYVTGLLEAPVLKGRTELVVDATGVGRPVVDMLRQRGLKPTAITITGGDTVTYDFGWRVPKRDLVASVQVLLQTERLKFADQIPAVPTLVKELLAFRVKIDPLTAHDSYGSWREGIHDDLVLAVAVAAWYGQRWQPPTYGAGLCSRSYPSD